MKPIKSLLILFLVLAPGAAFAQGYYGPGGGGVPREPGGFHHRAGLLAFGGSLGLGGMHDSFGDIDCANCDSVAGQISGYLGGMMNSRLALMGELQGNVQTLSVNNDGTDTSLVQSALMFAAQYWLTPQLWIKGGIGFANLQVQDADAFGVFAASRPENGTALMGAVGFELLSSQFFSVDLQGRLLSGFYDGIDDKVTALSIGVGLNWY
jgi:hypothetical protein